MIPETASQPATVVSTVLDFAWLHGAVGIFDSEWGRTHDVMDRARIPGGRLGPHA